MNYIEIYGNKATLFGDFTQQLLSNLDMELSYKPAGIEYSPAVRRGFYDGRTRLLSSNLSFPIGLVNRVVKFFKDFNIDIKVIDNNKYTESSEIDISDKLKKLNIIPRDYQIAACNAAINKKTGIIRVCTGGGKTLIAALIIAKVGKGKKSIVYVVGKSLLWQFKELFDKIFPGQVGVIGDGICEIKQINICSIWSIGLAYGLKEKIEELEDIQEKKMAESYYRDMRDLVSNSNVSIMDECHVGSAMTFQKISKQMLSEYKIGMSATPARQDNTNLLIESCFGSIIINVSASELIAKNYLVQPTIKFISIPKIRYPKEMTYKKIYSDYIVNNEVRNNLIIKGALSLIEQDFSTVILFKELAHGKIIYDKLNEKKIDFDLLSGKDSSEDRKTALDRITSGKSKLIVASSIFNVGIDNKKLSGLINAAGGKSKISTLQKIGRILRGNVGKDMAAVIDFYDQARYLKDHSIVRKETYQQESGFKVIISKEML
jgi:superfamily II DNA or RNA helicase